MPDADPVEVAFAFARNALIQTSREPGWTQVAGRLLTAALEYAVQGVFIAERASPCSLRKFGDTSIPP